MSKERAAQLVDAGVWLKLSGDLDGARRLFERALKLDPTNEKAKQLLSQPAGAAPPAEPPPPELPPPSNPFEREASPPSAVETDWGLATSAPPASAAFSIDDDWGRLTGASTPVPQSAPAPAPSSSPSATGLPPPPAFSSSPSQSTLQFAMPKEVRAASAPATPGTMMFALPDEVRAAAASTPSASPSTPGTAAPSSSPSGTLTFAMPAQVQQAAAPPASTPSAPGTMAFAMPDEVRQAIAAQPASSPSSPGTMAFAMPDEVRAAIGDAPPGATTKFSAMPAVTGGGPTPEDEFQALADQEETFPDLHVDRRQLRPDGPATPAVPWEDPQPPDERPPALGQTPPGNTSPFGLPAGASPASAPPGTMAFAMPAEVRAAMGQVPASTPSGTVAFPMPAEVKAAAGTAPASSPSGTMVFALPVEVKAAATAAPPDDSDEFGRLADEVEEIPLTAARPSRIAPLPRPAKGPARQPATAPAARGDDPDDWGRLTDDPARVASSDSFTAAPSSAGLPPPPAFESRPSQGTHQFAMPKDVRDASVPSASRPSGTMQFSMSDQVAKSSSPSGTRPFAMPKDVGPAPPEPAPVPRTVSLSGELPPQPPQNVVLTGDAEPPLPPRTTPPLFSTPQGGAVVLDGDAPPPSPPSATPPMFSDAAPAPGAFTPELLPPPPGPLEAPVPPAEAAWQWKSTSPPPLAPRPSPNLDPAAQSAWDARSNPGITLEAVVGADRALDLISSDSKVTRDPAKARAEEIATILRGARDLLDLDDHSGAMELIARAEKLAPDSPEVRQLKERSERTLLAMFESKLGHLDKKPRVLLKDDEIIWLNLDHRAGFVLAQIDGSVTFDDLFAVSGMSRLDTARILAQLVDEGVISRG
ncbi:MAG: hypothetical protein AB1730_22545 [Myxococcota bacterium]